MNKTLLVESLRAEFKRRYERAVAALAGAHEAATGADTKAENKYDTRGLEASYLAAGQAEQAEELQRGLSALEAFDFRDFDFDDAIETACPSAKRATSPADAKSRARNGVSKATPSPSRAASSLASLTRSPGSPRIRPSPDSVLPRSARRLSG